MLPRWLAYHGALFGHDNLFVFDNGSMDPKVKRDLVAFGEDRGVHVFRGHGRRSDMEDKGRILGETITDLDRSGRYDFFVPLDCDEFVGVGLPSGAYSGEPADVHAELGRHAHSTAPLRIGARLFNALQPDVFHVNPGWDPAPKYFFAAGTFKAMDIGSHVVQTLRQAVPIDTRLVHFHFHFKPFVLQRARARQILEARVDLRDRDALRAYDGPGRHLVKYLLMTEGEYQESLRRLEPVRTDAFSRSLERLGFTWPYVDGSESFAAGET